MNFPLANSLEDINRHSPPLIHKYQPLLLWLPTIPIYNLMKFDSFKKIVFVDVIGP
jgi:hypothetical protein